MRDPIPDIPVYVDLDTYELSLAPGERLTRATRENLVQVGVDGITLYVFSTYAEAVAFEKGFSLIPQDAQSVMTAPIAGYGVAAVISYEYLDTKFESTISTVDARDAFEWSLAKGFETLSAHERLAVVQRLTDAIRGA